MADARVPGNSENELYSVVSAALARPSYSYVFGEYSSFTNDSTDEANACHVQIVRNFLINRTSR